MALQGSLKDFSLADILQLIALQRKVGLLSLKSTEDTVTIGFEDGLLVSAESSLKKVDTRLGYVLVKSGRLTQEQLDKALEIQGQTLQRLGFILLRQKFCSAEDLSLGLDIQIKRIVYSLFRWRDGEYIFDQQDKIDYDREFVRPLAVENLLMEGARMIDEWPIVEKVVRSYDMVFRRIPLSQAIEVTEDDDDDTSGVKRASADEPIRITKTEAQVYEFVDGRRNVHDILDRTFLSEFDCCKALMDLVSRGLIEEVKKQANLQIDKQAAVAARRDETRMGVLIPLTGVLVVLLGASVWFQPRVPLNVWTFRSSDASVLNLFKKALSLRRLWRVSSTVDSYFLTTGAYPAKIEALVEGSFLRAGDLIDPWGHQYKFIPQDDKFYVVGLKPNGDTDPDLFISHERSVISTPTKGPADTVIVK